MFAVPTDRVSRRLCGDGTLGDTGDQQRADFSRFQRSPEWPIAGWRQLDRHTIARRSFPASGGKLSFASRPRREQSPHAELLNEFFLPRAQANGSTRSGKRNATDFLMC